MFYIHSLSRSDVQTMEYDPLKFIFILSEEEDDPPSSQGKKWLTLLLNYILFHRTHTHHITVSRSQ